MAPSRHTRPDTLVLAALENLAEALAMLVGGQDAMLVAAALPTYLISARKLSTSEVIFDAHTRLWGSSLSLVPQATFSRAHLVNYALQTLLA